jgi:hypothetical protein
VVICKSDLALPKAIKQKTSMSMRFGEHENIDQIATKDFDVFAQEVRIRKRQIKTSVVS